MRGGAVTGLLVLVGVVALAALLAGLGVWQWQRAGEKEVLEAQYRARARAPALRLTGMEEDAAALRYRTVELVGRYDPAHRFYVPARGAGRQLGYDLYVPLRLAGGTGVVVNRGWLPHDYRAGGPRAADTPAGTVQLRGRVVTPAHNPFAMEAAGDGRIWGQVDLARLAAAVPYRLMPVVVELEQGPGRLVTHWQAPDLRPERNRGYAFQWFAMALAVLFTYAWLRRRARRGADGA